MFEAFAICRDLYGKCSCETKGRDACDQMKFLHEGDSSAAEEKARIEVNRRFASLVEGA